MKAVVRTKEVKLLAEGYLSVFLIKALKTEFGRKLVLKESKIGKSYFSSSTVKSLKKLKTPGERLRCCREGLKMTQGKLGKKLKVSHNYVSAWERGTRPITKTKVIALGELFHLPYSIFES